MRALNDAFILENLSSVKEKSIKKHSKVIRDIDFSRRRISLIEPITIGGHVQVVYLQENCITSLANIESFPKVEYLYLQKNEISSMDHLENLEFLKVLYIGYNSISVVEKLYKCFYLEELHIEKQGLTLATPLFFEPVSIQAIAQSLRVLDVSGNHLTSIEPLACLLHLEELDASTNDIKDLKSVCWTLGFLRSLKKLDLGSNPICRDTSYKEKVIAAAYSLDSLDGKAILEVHKRFYKAFQNEKEQRSTTGLRHKSLTCSGNVQKLVDSLPSGVRMALKKSVSKELNFS